MADRSGPRILAVDDDPNILDVLHRILSKAGYEIIQASNGAEAIRRWRDPGADIVLLDVLMPEKDGLETIIELRASDPGVRIIAMSGGGSRSQRTDVLGDARMLGARWTLEKPFTPEEVLAVVRRALQEAD